MADTLIKYKGLADILVAGILTVNASTIYDSVPTRFLASLTGLHMSSAAAAPGFNQSIACMVAAVGVGHVVAAQYGRAARPPIFAMNLTWAILGFLTCATPHELGLGSATLLMSSFNHLAFSIALYFADPLVLGGKTKEG
ncbi:hypothetical protein Hypma_013090 [Hypsizygus marmoreus]|uniref:Uncharacterized protein n=1 Tax=Hypsizygus marmoreus TaxID=39966 RepID=A0A369JHH0_HYPMA|nr:hypothetical protein Hypma_013090 [Hypsizygus marmoreus]